MNIQSTLKIAVVAASAFAFFFAQPAEAADGKNAYKKYCQACHQPAGKGLAGVFPPLADNPNIKDRTVTPNIKTKVLVTYRGNTVSNK